DLARIRAGELHLPHRRQRRCVGDSLHLAACRRRETVVDGRACRGDEHRQQQRECHHRAGRLVADEACALPQQGGRGTCTSAVRPHQADLLPGIAATYCPSTTRARSEGADAEISAKARSARERTSAIHCAYRERSLVDSPCSSTSARRTTDCRKARTSVSTACGGD